MIIWFDLGKRVHHTEVFPNFQDLGSWESNKDALKKRAFSLTPRIMLKGPQEVFMTTTQAFLRSLTLLFCLWIVKSQLISSSTSNLSFAWLTKQSNGQERNSELFVLVREKAAILVTQWSFVKLKSGHLTGLYPGVLCVHSSPLLGVNQGFQCCGENELLWGKCFGHVTFLFWLFHLWTWIAWNCTLYGHMMPGFLWLKWTLCFIFLGGLCYKQPAKMLISFKEKREESLIVKHPGII